MTFYLQFGYPENPLGWQQERLFLDDKQHVECRVDDELEAESWFEAREQIGSTLFIDELIKEGA